MPVRGACVRDLVDDFRLAAGAHPGAGPHVADLVGELVYEDVVPERGLADVGARTAVHGKAVAVLPYDFDGAVRGAGLLGEQGGEAGGVRAADGDAGAQPGAGEVSGLLVGDESALLQGDDPVGAAGGLLGFGRGEQDRAALGGVRAQHAVQPTAFAGGEGVRGFVQHERVRVGQQGAGETETTVHSAREAAEAFVAQADEAHHFEDFVGAPGRNARRGTQHPEMAADRSGRMSRHVTEEHADLARRVGDAVQGAAPEVGDSTPLLEFEHEPERGCLARAWCSEECGDAARTRFEGDVVDGGRMLLAGVAGQSQGLDHPKQDSALCPFFRAPNGLLRSG